MMLCKPKKFKGMRWTTSSIVGNGVHTNAAKSQQLRLGTGKTQGAKESSSFDTMKQILFHLNYI